MELLRHDLSLDEASYNALLSSNNKTLLISGNKTFFIENMIRVSEVVKKTGIVTGRYEDYIIHRIQPLQSGINGSNVLLYLKKLYEFL